jgi:sugar lactone lactonase YvrE
VYRWTASAGLGQVARLEGAGGLGRLPDGRLLVLSGHDNRVYRREPDGELVVHADLSAIAPGQLNDMITDSRGRAYVGNYGFDYEARTRDAAHSALYAPPGVPQTAVICLEVDGSVLSLTDPLTFPNGCCFLDAGHTFVVAETLAFRLTAFTVLPDGRLSGPRPWASLIQPWLWRALNAPGVVGTMTRRVSAFMDRPRIAQRSGWPIAPDDIADAGDGTIWVANALRGESVRIGESGTVLERVRTSQHTLSCVVGGRDKTSLFVATVPTLDAEESGRLNGGRIECLQLTEE